jgi:hypothetical protein
MTTPADLYRTCRVSALRLETRQDYRVPGDEARQRAFHAGEPLPPPGPGKAADLELITRLRQRGVNVGRVHVITRPISDYVRYELAVYGENVAAGEDVLIADASVYPELAGLTQDFALFDSETAVLFGYGEDGVVRGYQITKDQRIVRHCLDRYSTAAARAVPRADFVAAAIL